MIRDLVSEATGVTTYQLGFVDETVAAVPRAIDLAATALKNRSAEPYLRAK